MEVDGYLSLSEFRVRHSSPVLIIVVMSRRRHPSRADIRATREAERAAKPVWPDARVYGVNVWDANGFLWEGQIIFYASSPEEAHRRMEKALLTRGSAFMGILDPDEIPQEGRDLATRHPDHLFRRVDLLPGRPSPWSCWEKLAPNYLHPAPGIAAADPDVRGPSGARSRGDRSV